MSKFTIRYDRSDSVHRTDWACQDIEAESALDAKNKFKALDKDYYQIQVDLTNDTTEKLMTNPDLTPEELEAAQIDSAKLIKESWANPKKLS